MRILEYSKKNPAKFHPGPIWSDGAKSVTSASTSTRTTTTTTTTWWV